MRVNGDHYQSSNYADTGPSLDTGMLFFSTQRPFVLLLGKNQVHR